MASVAVALAFVGVALDVPVTHWLQQNLGWTFTGEAEGASSVLGIIAGSMITITGVAFSMTLVALSLAASQLGPRLLRNFMRDTTTQVVLGSFIATFLYSLVVLRMIRRSVDSAFVPHLSVTLGVLLAVVSVGVFIYFIHHVAISIQTNEVAARIGKELIVRIEQLFPERPDQGEAHNADATPDENSLASFERGAQTVEANGDGYLQFIDEEALLALAMEEDLLVRLVYKPGDYIIASCPLAMISPGIRVTDQISAQICSFFVLGHQRTSDQDIEFAVNQLVEVAVRALSPGVNDTFTAITCIDHLGSALCRLATRGKSSPYRLDQNGQRRVFIPTISFPQIADVAFNQIRQHSRSSAAVTIHLLRILAVVLGFTRRPEDRDALLRQAEMIARGSSDGLPEEQDRQAVKERFQAVKDLCPEL